MEDKLNVPVINVGDMIYRQAAIDALDTIHYTDREDWWAVLSTVEALPTVQAEPLTDVEQRIFLSAMSREKEVCKAVDKEMSDKKAPYEYNLVSVCEEIKRKVKAALWKN